MMFSAIIAMSENRVIGKNNHLPWHLPADLQHFKRITMGKPILMGRKTYQSIGRPLPGRLNIVITRDKDFHATGCMVVTSIAEALSAVSIEEEFFLIGGADLFKQLLPQLQRLYLTIIHHEFEGDTYLPEFSLDDWIEIAREDHKADDVNRYDYSFIMFERSGHPFV